MNFGHIGEGKGKGRYLTLDEVEFAAKMRACNAKNNIEALDILN